MIFLSLSILTATIPLYYIVFKPNYSTVRGTNFGRLVIEEGDVLGDVAGKLLDAGLIESRWKFLLTGRLLLLENRIPVGLISIPAGLSNFEIFKRIIFNRTNTANVTIREGWPAKIVAGYVQKRADIDSLEFMESVYDTNFIRDLGIEAPSLEGYLYPETYNLYVGMDAKEAIKRMVGQFNRVFNDSLKSRAFKLGFSVNQIITLASIIEGEIIYNSEANIVSSVYHNRLRIGMALQADPTIQYIIPDGPRRLKYSDLKIDSPYNTYLRRGLPPGPIGNPGRRTIMAALYPQKTPYLYFVAKGDGYHTFSSNIEEHMNAKLKFNKYRRQVEKEKEELAEKNAVEVDSVN